MKILIIEEGLKSEEYLMKVLRDNGFNVENFPNNVLMISPEIASTLQILQVKDVVMDKNTRKVYVKGKEVKLTSLRQKLLGKFMANAGRVLTRETLLANVWEYTTDVETRTVDVNVYEINKALGDKYIIGRRSMGYVMEK